MAEIGGQNGQETFWVLIGFVPAYERVRRKSVSHVMEAWATTLGETAQADRSGQCIKRSMDISRVQAVAQAGAEQVWRSCLYRAMTPASRDVVRQHLAG